MLSGSIGKPLALSKMGRLKSLKPTQIVLIREFAAPNDSAFT